MENIPATLAREILDSAYQKKASDIHFYPSSEKDLVNIYFRIHGKRTFQQNTNKTIYQLLLTYFKFSANMDIGEIRKPQDGVILHESVNKQAFYLRLSTLPVSNIESLTIRILPQSEAITSKELFLFPAQFAKMKSWLKQKSGIILVTGPTGSGKSTTMYALIESMIKDSSSQVITLEDPIERQIDEVLQVEINEKAGISYQAGLKAALRHDPDVLLIGEIRDEKTAEFSFEASLTGHLVISTLHAKDVLGTIDRLIDLGITRNEISQTLIAIASIQLIPIIGKNEVVQRAAIVELLDGQELAEIILRENQHMIPNYLTFNHLREKAFIYGFISKETYDEIDT